MFEAGSFAPLGVGGNRHKKSVNGSNILFMGVADKPNINDERESPALEIIDTVIHKGGKASYHDPYIPAITTPDGKKLESVSLTQEMLLKTDCVVLTTNHKTFDVGFIEENSSMIVDLRNMIPEASDKVYKL